MHARTARSLTRTSACLVVVVALSAALSIVTSGALFVTSAGAAPKLHAATALKPALTGLVSQTGVPAPEYASVISGVAVSATWAALQPEQGGPIVADNAIDNAIAKIRMYNDTHPAAKLSIKLRVRAGVYAPDWAKNLDGPPVYVRDQHTGVTGTIGRFWTPNFAAAYLDLQQKLAALYDGVPEVSEVVASRCTTVTAEPFIRDRNDAFTVHNLLAAGFTQALDHECIRDMFRAHRVWTDTRTAVAFSGYEAINANGKSSIDVDFTSRMINACRDILGPRCVAENDHLTSNSGGPLLLSLAAAGGANGLQAAACAEVGNISGALNVAANFGFHSVELCPGFQTLVTPGQLSVYPERLATAHFTPPAPTATTILGDATGPTSADVLGTVRPNGAETFVHVDYGTTPGYGLKSAPIDAGNWTTTHAITIALGGLVPATTYHVRVVAVSSSGTAFGVDRLVSTPRPPLVVTYGATAPGPGVLHVKGSVGPRGAATTYWFQYGTTTSYGKTSPARSVGSGTAIVSVAAKLSHLTPGVVYHYRLVASNPSGTAYGLDRKQQSGS